MDGGANTGMFDKGRFSLESVEYRSSVKELLKLYSSKVHEFESSNFNLEVLRSSIVGTKSTSSNDLSDFSSVCEVISNSTSSRAILVYRCHELSSNGIQILSRLNAFLSRSKSNWKVLYFGELQHVFPLHLRQLAIDKTFGEPIGEALASPSSSSNRTLIALSFFAVVGASTILYQGSTKPNDSVQITSTTPSLNNHDLNHLPPSDSPAGQDSSTTIKDICLLYTSPSPRDQRGSRMPSSA